MTEITRRFVEANGLRTHLTEAGTGPLVLLLHAFPETAYNRRHQMAPPAAVGHHVVAPERGYGRTSRPEATEEYTILHLVGDVVGLVEALGEGQAVVVGHDWAAPSPGTPPCSGPTWSAAWPHSAPRCCPARTGRRWSGCGPRSARAST
ncbi:alpha/beta fold hydrolase [Streptomyces sp. NPDC003710]